MKGVKGERLNVKRNRKSPECKTEDLSPLTFYGVDVSFYLSPLTFHESLP